MERRLRQRLSSSLDLHTASTTNRRCLTTTRRPPLQTPLELAQHYVALPAKYHPRHKPTCTEPVILIGAVEYSNGATQHKAYCFNCRQKGGAIAHDALASFDLSCVEVIASHNQAKCERCGSVGAETHHWAPYHLFDDAYDWPTSSLCRRCHTLWHAKMTRSMNQNNIRRNAA